MLKANSMVVTSKGNYGRVMSMNTSTAQVKIGYKIHEIELYNLIDVTDGAHLKVTYSVDNDPAIIDLLFLKHGSILFDMYNAEGTTRLLNLIENTLLKKLNITNIKILKIQIP